jgi:hypothetical protein
MVFTYERNVKRCEYPKDDCENYLFEDYPLKSGITIWTLTLKSSGGTNLFYQQKYFRKVERESKAEQKRGRRRQLNSTGPTFLRMTPFF